MDYKVTGGDLSVRNLMKDAPKDVDSYIERAPRDLKGRLRRIREVIMQAVPEAKERISYGMPYYEYKGRLVYFSLAKEHIGLYVPTPIIEEHRGELSDYETTDATVRLPLDKEIPIALVRMLVIARMEKNEARERELLGRRSKGDRAV